MIGAPWAHLYTHTEHQAGNGGLSLRHKSRLLRTLKKNPGGYEVECCEDRFDHCV